MAKPKLPPNFVPENHLEELLVKAIDNPESRPEFYRELLKSDVVTLGKPSPGHPIPEGYHRLETGAKIEVRLLEYKGEPVVAIYSSMKRMTDVIPEQYYTNTGYITLNCKTLFQVLGPRTYALNPGHMIVQSLLPHQVEALLDGSIFEKLEEERKKMVGPQIQPLPKGAQIQVGRPKTAPSALIAKLIDYFRATGGNIEQAYVGQIYIPSSGLPPHLMLVLELSKESTRTFDEISVDLGPIIRSELREGEPLDLFQLNKEPNLSVSDLIRFFPP